MERHQLSTESAAKVRLWIKDRGGAQVFQSIDLSDPGRQMIVPLRGPESQPVGKPHWSMANETSRIITSETECEVCLDVEVRRFRVAIRLSGNGLMLKCSDASSERIRKAVEKAGRGAYHEFDYETQEAVIFAPERIVPMEEWNPDQVLADIIKG